jgi:hypothetical protein
MALKGLEPLEGVEVVLVEEVDPQLARFSPGRAGLGQDGAVADDILELQRAFDDAELHGDAERLGDLLADDFLSIGEQGFQLGKREWIGRHGEFRYLSIETTEMDVRRYDKTAIVRCVQRSRASWRGETMALAVRLSQVWIWGSEGWQLVAIQFSTLGSG